MSRIWLPYRSAAFLVPMILGLSPGSVSGFIPTPRADQLCRSADLIVVGKVESVGPTALMLLWLAAGAASLLAAIWIVVAGVRRGRYGIVPVVLVCSIPIAMIWAVPPWTFYRFVATASVSSVIKGSPPQDPLRVYYYNGFVCDATSFSSGAEYVLFLKKASRGYTVSWWDWSQWKIDDAQVQTRRRTWNDEPPISMKSFIAKIQEVCAKEADDAKHPPEKAPAAAPDAEKSEPDMIRGQ
jgi:hypothetical protein